LGVGFHLDLLSVQFEYSTLGKIDHEPHEKEPWTTRMLTTEHTEYTEKRTNPDEQALSSSSLFIRVVVFTTGTHHVSCFAHHVSRITFYV
jgi:hypothetical protein